ncbi:bombesin receptor subtype-3-like isoform X2 [Patiria miniata]|uniref:G-protein coupled receptors family 1 profile domain-containing protein n=1 Tax=Patiria miniata TaxID=46514 RepID=A0A914A5D9_PATMI|nr:bombesin receptor subtype-3-like isoform X2 [Patiria miniata]XP_038058621.1 bombesin receptor subtype-3-like isoform X2 [Patiria miniata]
MDNTTIETLISINNDDEEGDCNAFLSGINQSVLEAYCSMRAYEMLGSPLNIFMYIVVLTGVVGNVALLTVILKNRPLRTTPNMLVINVTLGDLMYLIVVVPTRLEYQVAFCFPDSEPLCKFASAWQVLAQGVCIFSIMAVSCERYGAITQHLGRSLFRGSARKTGFLIGLVWLASLVIAVPVYATASLHGGFICTYLPHFTPVAKGYVTVLLVCHYIVPLLVITILYSRMAHTLIRSADSFRGENQPGAKQFRARRRLAIIVLVIAVFFGVFWMPCYIYNMYYQFAVSCDTISDKDHIYEELRFFAALINSCFNPWIVFIMSSTHQRMLMRCICYREPGSRTTERRTNMTTLRSNSFMNSTKTNYTEITSSM